MIPSKTRCPSKVVFAKALQAGEPTVIQNHLEHCSECAAQWTSQQRLIQLAQALPKHTLSQEKATAQHNALIQRATYEQTTTPPQSSRLYWQVAAAVVLLIGLGLGGWFWQAHTKHNPTDMVNPITMPEHRAKVHSAAATEYKVISKQPDEIVRVFNGTVTVSVDKLQPNERFRVITGDAEVEVKGTVFDVTTVNDQLVSVRVMSGQVEVRPMGKPSILLAKGARWYAKDTIPMEESEPPLETNDIVPEKNQSLQLNNKKQAQLRALKNSKRKKNTRAKHKQSLAGPKTTDISPSEQLFNQGWHHFKNHDYFTAATAFKEVLSNSQHSSLSEDAAYWLAMAYYKGKQKKQAQRAMDQYLIQYAHSKRAGDIAILLGWYKLDSGQLDSAHYLFKMAAKSNKHKVRQSAAKGLESINNR